MTAAIAEVPRAKTPAALPSDSNSASQNIPLGRIVPSITNRKAEVDNDFIDSIKQHGVLEPILVREVAATIDHVTRQPVTKTPFGLADPIYEIVCGERRFRAAREAKLLTIPAVIRKLTGAEAMELQIVENDQRENLSPIDRAEAYFNLLAQYQSAHKGRTDVQCLQLIGDKVNRELRTVQQIIALKKLCWQCQAALRQGEMEASHGYELCRRSEEEQLQLLAWLRKETQHSQGDVPSVRRLKLEIRNMDIAADEKRRQEKLFKDPQPGTATTKVPTVEEAATSARAADNCQWRCGMCDFINEPRNKKKCKKCGAERGYGSSYQSPARAVTATPVPKPPSKAYLKAEAEQREKDRKAQLKSVQQARVDRKYRALFFTALAKKAHVCSRLLTHLIPDMLFELWEQDAVPPEGFAPDLLQWPAPKRGDSYDYSEVKEHANKHTRKYSGNLLSALLIFQHMAPPDAERLAKYFGVDVKKLRQKAATAVKEEDAKAGSGKKGAKA